MLDYEEARRRYADRLREADERHLARIASAESRRTERARRMLGTALVRLGRRVAGSGAAVSAPPGARSGVA
ncbi:MAG TPA: hypothetical protein VIA06_13520 [Candidatus Dormibacteraeota bacterium]|jgi:hypothetical protein|nr:hypothetical protein [Candidatus Dormibacteraeota bacterium]